MCSCESVNVCFELNYTIFVSYLSHGISLVCYVLSLFSHLYKSILWFVFDIHRIETRLKPKLICKLEVFVLFFIFSLSLSLEKDRVRNVSRLLRSFLAFPCSSDVAHTHTHTHATYFKISFLFLLMLIFVPICC